MQRGKINLEKLTLLINDGYTIYQIADYFDVCKKTVYNNIKKYNIITSSDFWRSGHEYKYVFRPLIEQEDLKKLISDGYTIWQIIENTDISKSAIRSYIKRWNLIVPKGFFSRGLKVGRSPGFKLTDEQLERCKQRMQGEFNPFFGKKHSLQTREKMKLNHADFNGENNPFKKSLLDPKKREEHKQRCKEIWNLRDEVWRQKFAEKRSKIAAENINKSTSCHKRHKSKMLLTVKAGEIFCRSSWEEKLASLLDIDPNVKSFSLEEFYIPYKLDGFVRNTRIDFLVRFNDDSKFMIEVKPKGLIKYAEHKINAMRKFCEEKNIKFAVWSLDEINEYERFIQIK